MAKAKIVNLELMACVSVYILVYVLLQTVMDFITCKDYVFKVILAQNLTIILL
jgi:hypothetical protein